MQYFQEYICLNVTNFVYIWYVSMIISVQDLAVSNIIKLHLIPKYAASPIVLFLSMNTLVLVQSLCI